MRLVSSSTVETFGPVTAKHCGTRIIFQFFYIWLLSHFLFNVTLELFCERVQVSCLVEKKKKAYSLHFCHFLCWFWRGWNLGFGFLFCFGLLLVFVLFCFFSRKIFPRRQLCEVQDFFLIFFFCFFSISWEMLNKRIV